MFSMSPLKAPGVNSFQAKFFQSQWAIVGSSVCEFVRQCLQRHPLDPFFNLTLLVLLPKVPSPKSISRFFLIGLCTVLYKID